MKSPVILKGFYLKPYTFTIASSVKKISFVVYFSSPCFILGLSLSNGRCSGKTREANGATDGGVAEIRRATSYAVCRICGATGSSILVFSFGGGTDASASVRLLY
jgi:hypothetical protein